MVTPFWANHESVATPCGVWLPPPPLARSNQCKQRRMGIALATGIAALETTASVGIATIVRGGFVHASALAVHVLASAALVLYARLILFRSSAIIHRTAETSLPVPSKVSDALAVGDPLLSNVIGDDSRTYCVRCFVWRPAVAKSHHCSICQRCVTGFDHHCHIMGLCIDDGNLASFRALLSVTAMGLVACFVCVTGGLLHAVSDDEAQGGSFPGRLGLAFATFAACIGLIVLVCKVIGRMCQSARKLSELASVREDDAPMNVA